MGFTCAVVANNQYALVIDHFVKLQLIYHGIDEIVCHGITNDIAFHIAAPGGDIISGF